MACFLLCVVTMALMVARRETRAALRKSTQTRLLAYLFLSTTAYLCVQALHTEHYWNYHAYGSGNNTAQRHQWQVRIHYACSGSVYIIQGMLLMLAQRQLCEVIGLAGQCTGSVQLFFVLGVSAYFTYHSMRFCCYKTHLEIPVKVRRAMEITLVVVALVVPALYVWVPYRAVPYGETGPWCWIQTLDRHCHRIKGAFWEQMGIWYIPLGIAALVALLSIVLFILGLCVYLPHVKKRRRQKKGEACVLIVFLSAYCVLFLTEFVTHIVSFKVKHDMVGVWALYGVSAPLGAVPLPIGLLIFTYTRTLRDVVNQYCTCHYIRRKQIFITLFRNTSSFTRVRNSYNDTTALLFSDDAIPEY